MENPPKFDLNDAHRFFSADCFNHAWDYIDKPRRTPEEDQTMLLLTMASLWHWKMRPDVTEGNLSIGYWQVSRVYALINQPENARIYGQLCLAASKGEGCLPFHLGYAYETLARAEALSGNQLKAQEYIELGKQVSEEMTDPDAKKQLLDDLATIR
jgi:hypothetical protein